MMRVRQSGYVDEVIVGWVDLGELEGNDRVYCWREKEVGVGEI